MNSRGMLEAVCREAGGTCRGVRVCQEGAEDSLQGTPLPDTPLSMHAPTWEDLHITQTRAMLELRVMLQLHPQSGRFPCLIGFGSWTSMLACSWPPS